MQILSHRGYWKTAEEKNQTVAFRRSCQLGFGTETDIRDYKGQLVISHDIATEDSISLKEFIDIFKNSGLVLALNIKADGLATPLLREMQFSGIENWFVFDMSIPDMKAYLKSGIPTFARMSEVEKDPAWIDQISGIWLDCFNAQWYDSEFISSLLQKQLKVCLVSPELHGREYFPLWYSIKALVEEEGLLLCTDFPEQAKSFFGVT